MHGTGTPLGDPIEAGAAAAVLFDSRRPLALMASKTWSGHAEPAAGMVALAHAQAALSGSQLLPLLHFRCITTSIVLLSHLDQLQACSCTCVLLQDHVTLLQDGLISDE